MHHYLETYFGKEHISSIEPLAKAGSDRKYYRVTANDQTFIACESLNIAENETFFYFSEFFKQHQIPVPVILHISEDRTHYIQEDLGNMSLLERVISDGHTEQVKKLYESAIHSLVNMQLVGGKDLDFTKCYAAASFDKQAILADLNYFKYYFLDPHNIQYNKPTLNLEFDQLAEQIGRKENAYFMYRDFQGRNIMVKDDTPYFIDYQGGMKGPLQYDIASLLWQAKAQLPSGWKKELYLYYKQELSKQVPIEEATFDDEYSMIVLVRLLQVLGAYGLRGIIEQRTHFLSSIPAGLSNLCEWLNQFSLQHYPELNKVLNKMLNEIQVEKYLFPTAGSDNKLKVVVQSFSYKKGLPDDESGNGGGFVFDCRGILNPGRFEEYKKLTGRDQPVKDFLESKTRVHEFLKHAMAAVDISIEDYLNRGFEHLMISFGCTGGQHRSVYCTDAMAKHLNEKYHLEASVRHLVQDAKDWKND